MENRQQEMTPEDHIQSALDRHPNVREVIIFPPTLPWEGEMFQRPQQLARALARQGALVFYLQPERTRPATFKEIEPGLVICSTPTDAFHLLPKAYVYTLTWSIPLLAYFDQQRVIYDYLDDLSVFQGDPKRLRRDHDDTLQRAELVLATSRDLEKQARMLREDVVYCPNGADFEHFHQPDKDDLPKDLAPILDTGRPLVGYHGALASWFDYPLVIDLARMRTDLEFVLIGVAHDNSLKESGLLDLPNLHWLGPKPYQELPGYLQHFQAGIIPFQVNQLTNATSPIKLFEYFAAGVPPVISPMAESLRYEGVLPASSLEEWSQALDQALTWRQDSTYQEKLLAAGQAQSWEARANLILQKLAALDSEPPQRPWYLSEKSSNPALSRGLRILGRVIKVFKTSGLKGVLQGVYYKLFDQIARLRRKRWIQLPRKWQQTYQPEDNSQVTLYTDDPDLFPDYQPRRNLLKNPDLTGLEVSIISPMLNESESIPRWLETLRAQTTLPAEVIVVDNGSTDGSPELIEQAAVEMPFPLRVIHLPGANIAQARNTAIQQAGQDLLVTLDLGCFPQPDWLEKLLIPFLDDPDLEVGMPWFIPITPGGKKSYPGGWPKLEDIHPQRYVPASRSLAFTRSAWEKARGYPEWLTLSGEDTYFALELKRYSEKWAFIPSSVVEWQAPGSWISFLKKTFYWSTGNGETGITARLYHQSFKRLVLFVIGFILAIWVWVLSAAQFRSGSTGLGIGLSLVGAASLVLGLFPYLREKLPVWKIPAELSYRATQVLGFFAGARRKAVVDRLRLVDTQGLYIILTGVPIDDTGGGARCTQITLELLRQNYWVVYLNRYPKWESQDAGVHIAHPNLYTHALGEFYWDDFLEEFGSLVRSRPLIGLIEKPHPDFLPLINRIQEEGGKIIYELIDDWDSALGGEWYSREIEREVIRLSEGLVGTAPLLQERLEELSGREALFLPNAVNSRLFQPNRYYPRPGDLPEGEFLALYIGALWGEWFDWELLLEIARTYPEAIVAVIGDYKGQCPQPQPTNLHFLGLKAQTRLPGYLAHADVALIPWEVSPITQATSPLKLYEYLAMRVPVVAPKLDPLEEIPGVRLAEDQEHFLKLVKEAVQDGLSVEEVDNFIAQNDWKARVRMLREYVKDLPGTEA